MKQWILIFAAVCIGATTATAGRIDLSAFSSCGGALSEDQGLWAQVNRQGQVEWLQSGDTQVQRLETTAAVDVEIAGDKAWVLTERRLQVWDLRRSQLVAEQNTHFQKPGAWSRWQRPRALAVSASEVFIAHGSLGVSVLDRETLRLTGVIPQEEISEDVVTDRDHLYILVSNARSKSFRGVSTLKLSDFGVVNAALIVNAAPQAFALVGDQFYISFFNAIWSFDKDRVIRRSKAKKRRFAWQFLKRRSLVGQPLFRGEDVIFCVRERHKEPPRWRWHLERHALKDIGL